MKGYKTVGLVMLVCAALAASGRAAEMDQLKAMAQSPEAAARGFSGNNAETDVSAPAVSASNGLQGRDASANQEKDQALTAQDSGSHGPLQVADNDDGGWMLVPVGATDDSSDGRDSNDPGIGKKILGTAAAVGAGILGAILGLVLGPILTITQGWTFWQGLASPVIGAAVEADNAATWAYDSVTGENKQPLLKWPGS